MSLGLLDGIRNLDQEISNTYVRQSKDTRMLGLEKSTNLPKDGGKGYQAHTPFHDHIHNLSNLLD